VCHKGYSFTFSVSLFDLKGPRFLAPTTHRGARWRAQERSRLAASSAATEGSGLDGSERDGTVSVVGMT